MPKTVILARGPCTHLMYSCVPPTWNWLTKSLSRNWAGSPRSTWLASPWWRSPSAPRGRGRRTTHCTAAVQPQVPCPGGQAQLVDVAHPKVQAVHSWHLTTRTLVEATSICTPTLKFLYKSVPRSYAFHSQNKSLEVKIAYLTFLRCLLL